MIAAAAAGRPFFIAQDKEPERTLHVVGTAHLDTQWRWTIQKSITDYIPNTLKTNLEYFDLYPHYVFSFEGSIRYQLAKEYYPDLYAQMKKRIAEGKWRVTGSWIDAVDVNISSPEALIRQNLYGNGFFKKEFGKTSADVFLPDCFGFSYALPSIAAHCGLKGFSTQKLLPYGSTYGGVPFNIGAWEGVDGSVIPAVLEPGRYRHDVGSDWSKADWLIKRIDALGSASGLYLDYQYHGTGDVGGGPTKKSMENLESAIAAGGPIKVMSAGADQLFRDLTPAQIAKLPAYKGEFLMATHGTGCYTTQSAVKKWNRENELLADSAERAATMASLLGRPYPLETLNQAWTRFLWHGFHDDLTGTSIPEAYAFTWNDQLLSLNQFAQILTDSLAHVSRSLDTEVKGIPLVVYNPVAAKRSDLVVADVDFKETAPSFVEVFNEKGESVPAQVVESEGRRAKIAFAAESEGTGVQVYDVRPVAAEPKVAGELRIDGRSLENGKYLVRVNDEGDIASIFDKRLNRELLLKPVRLAVLTDKPARYPAWEMRYEDVCAEPVGYVSGPAEITIAERGPARAALRIVRTYGGTKIEQIVSLSAGGERVESDYTVDWRGNGTMLKAEFSLAEGNPKATYDIGLGTIERGNNTKQSYEVPAQQWADLSSANGPGATILTNCKYGWDKPNYNTLRLTLLRTPVVAEKDYQFNNDIGRHRFGYAIYGHTGDWRNGASSQGERYNQPMAAFQTEKHPGKLGRSFVLAKTDSAQVAVKAIKRAENGTDWIVRVFETRGKDVKGATIEFGIPIISVSETDGFETPLAKPTLPVVVNRTSVRFDMSPYRPRTFAVRLGSAGTSQIRATSVKLPFNIDAVSKPNEKSDQPAIPAELWPSKVNVGDSTLNLGKAGSKNAVECRGQTISLPKGSRLVMLANSIEGDVDAVFGIGDQRIMTTIRSQSGFVGQWDSRLVNGTLVKDPELFGKAFINRTPVAWIGTHRHGKDGKDEPYVFCYLFRYEFDLPDGARTLKLPNDPRVRVFAVSVLRDKLPMFVPCRELYD